MQSEEIPKKQFIKASLKGTKCQLCGSEIKSRGDVLRHAEKGESGRYKISLLGICCAFKK